MKDRLEKEYYTWNVKDFYFGGGGGLEASVEKLKFNFIYYYLFIHLYHF